MKKVILPEIVRWFYGTKKGNPAEPTHLASSAGSAATNLSLIQVIKDFITGKRESKAWSFTVNCPRSFIVTPLLSTYLTMLITVLALTVICDSETTSKTVRSPINNETAWNNDGFIHTWDPLVISSLAVDDVELSRKTSFGVFTVSFRKRYSVLVVTRAHRKAIGCFNRDALGKCRMSHELTSNSSSDTTPVLRHGRYPSFKRHHSFRSRDIVPVRASCMFIDRKPHWMYPTASASRSVF